MRDRDPSDVLVWDRMQGGYARSGVIEIDLQPLQPPVVVVEGAELIDFRAGSHARIRERTSNPRQMTEAERLAVEAYLRDLPQTYLKRTVT
jgi:hypothetical protein